MLGIPVALLLAWKERYVDRAIWGAIWRLLPVVVVCGAVLLVRGSLRRRADSLLEQKIFLVLSVTAACSLIQFPFTIPIYFCYVAPLAFLVGRGGELFERAAEMDCRQARCALVSPMSCSK